jgi:hypothetical protein
LAARISTWDPAMSGWPVDQTGWRISMTGKDSILIGGTMPFGMTVSEPMLTDIFSQWDMAGWEMGRLRRSRRKTNNIDRARFRFCLASRCLGLGGMGYGRASLKLALPLIMGNAAEFLPGFLLSNFDVANCQ